MMNQGFQGGMPILASQAGNLRPGQNPLQGGESFGQHQPGSLPIPGATMAPGMGAMLPPQDGFQAGHAQTAQMAGPTGMQKGMGAMGGFAQGFGNFMNSPFMQYYNQQ
jgi:hypothetical protein